MITALLVVVAFAAGVFVGRLTRRSSNRLPSLLQPNPVELKYGHPWPPVSELRKKLPPAPQGHAWETAVTTNDRGESILTLTLVNVLPATNVGSYRLNLTRDSYNTYASDYRAYSSIKDHTFNKMLGPAIDWAAALSNKVESEGQTTDYRIG